jgi:hypothetical protein
MNKSQHIIDFSELNLNISDVERVVGTAKDENQKVVSEMIGEVLYDAGKICEIKCEYNIIAGIRVVGPYKVISIKNQDFNLGKIVWAQMRGSESVAVFLCTAGRKISEKSRKLMNDNDFLKGFIYDVAGSEIVEAAADIMQQRLKEKIAKSGKRITNRFSPGYCGWNVSEQHKLFQLIPDNFCGICLNESALMDPIKSVSGFIGIGNDVKYIPYTCSICDDRNCIYRKVRDRSTLK